VHDIGIGGDRIEAFAPAADGFHFVARSPCVSMCSTGSCKPQRAADPLELLDHGSDQAVGAALGPPHAAILFQLVDQRVDRAGLHRIAAYEQACGTRSASRSFSFS
jgi:hypothetical protein